MVISSIDLGTLSILEIAKLFTFDGRNSNCLWRYKIKRLKTRWRLSKNLETWPDTRRRLLVC